MEFVKVDEFKISPLKKLTFSWMIHDLMFLGVEIQSFVFNGKGQWELGTERLTLNAESLSECAAVLSILGETLRDRTKGLGINEAEEEEMDDSEDDNNEDE